MTLTDDCESLLRTLADTPTPGLSQDELAAMLGWNQWTVNDVLCSLGRQVQLTPIRVKGRKINKYGLRTL